MSGKQHFILNLILLVLVNFLISSCTTTKVFTLKDKINTIKKIAIIYEPSNTEKSEKLILECSSSIKNGLTRGGLHVIEQELIQSSVNRDLNKMQKGKCYGLESSGADALVIFKIPEYREEKRIGFRKKRTDGLVFNTFGMNRKLKPHESEEEIIDIRTFYFKIEMTMIICATGETVLRAENIMTKATDELQVYRSLADFKDYILHHLAKDLEKALIF